MERARVVGGLIASTGLLAAMLVSRHEPDSPHVEVAPAQVPITLDPDQLSFLIDVDGVSYVELGDPPDHPAPVGVTAHRDADRVRLVGELAAAPRPRELVVDGGCVAQVGRLAVLATTTPDDPHPTLDGGSLVGRLDGCAGTWARAAALPRPVTAAAATAPAEFVDAARADALTTEPGVRALQIWRDHESAPFPIASRVVQHPLTHARWIVVHAEWLADDCHDPSFALTAVYRLDGDALVRTSVASVHVDLDAELIDLANDGTFELIDADSVIDLAGNVLATRPDRVPDGCGC